MPRLARIDIAGEVYHVINRANAQTRIFKAEGDFNSVVETLKETIRMIPIDIFSFSIMSNHWHFAVRPRRDGDLGKFFGRFTQKVTQRWHKYRQIMGAGHLFQGRYKSFLVQTDSYFIQLMKYIEANPLRAGLVSRAEEWRWGSLYMRAKNGESGTGILASWPVDMPSDYAQEVNRPLQKAFMDQVRNSITRGRPLGHDEWITGKVREYGLE